jgi:alpha-glucosidase (family GH31 glycosyl hydrolase)
VIARLALAALAAAAAGCEPPPPPRESPPPPVAAPAPAPAGQVRFTALTPTLVRLEWSADGAFDDRPSFNAANPSFARVPMKERSDGEWQIACTERICVHYRRGSGRFAAANHFVELPDGSGRSLQVTPDWSGAPDRDRDNLGGWYRALDNLQHPVALHEGLLSRRGWYLLDDSATATWDGAEWRAPADHQSGYFFAYGHDYKHALRELSQLTGKIPLLPRWAYGLWYSRYYPYSQNDYEALITRFRKERVPLDVLVVDTDWKWPFDWNGWSFNPVLFPDPARFFHFADTQSLQITLNVHPSINIEDGRYPSLALLGHGLTQIRNDLDAWDWADAQKMESYFAAHEPLEKFGVRFWWLDWCCEPAPDSLDGAPPDALVNQQYAARDSSTEKRGFAFSRIGGYFASYGESTMTRAGAWAEHRNTVHFTGDTHPTWEMLAWQTMLTIAEGNLLMSHVSHDIGSFHAKHLTDELYVRWMQLGAFQPIMRLHSNHGDRLPWDYGDDARRAAEEFVRLRRRLSAYLYSTAREAHDFGIPIVRGLYLDYPDYTEAYRYFTEYFFGDSLLVAPVVTPAPQPTEAWLPPGRWYDFFTDDEVAGGAVYRLQSGWHEMPLYVRAGAIIPLVGDGDAVGREPPDAVEWHIWPGADGHFRLYDDAGDGQGYLDGDFAFTDVSYDDAARRVTIAPAAGKFRDRLSARVHSVVFHDGSGVIRRAGRLSMTRATILDLH